MRTRLCSNRNPNYSLSKEVGAYLLTCHAAVKVMGEEIELAAKKLPELLVDELLGSIKLLFGLPAI